MKIPKILRWFVILSFSMGLACLLLFVQSDSFSAAGPAPGDFGPAHSSLFLREGQVFSLEEEGLDFSSRAGDINGSTSVFEGWHSYPIYGGEMTSIAIVTDTTITQTVYVGTRDAGVFKTTDGGQSWQPARAGLTFYPIRSLQVDPQNPNILYAGTDYDGIWKSTDGGESWSKSSNGLDESLIVFQIVFDPQDTDTLYAGLAGGYGLCIGNIYKSEDGGATWAMKDNGIPRYSETHTNGIFSLAIDTANSALLYAGTNFDGVFKSTDGGETWTTLNAGLPFRSGSTEYRESVNALAVDPHHANRLSAIIAGDYYVFDSDSWQKVDQGIYHANSGLFTDYLYFHPTDPAIIYSAGDRFSKSADAGINWAWLLGWDDSGNVPEIAFHPSSPDTIYAATDILMRYWGGVYKSNNQGETWAEISQGITAAVIESLAVDPQNSNYIYAGEGNGHFYRTQDGGVTWQRDYLGGFGVSDIAVDPLDSQNIYAADGLDLLRSTDQGATFNRITQVESAECLAIAPHASSPIYVGASFGHGIYKSSDGGTTWTQKNEGLPIFGSSICPILSLAIDPHDPDTVWAGMQYGGGIVMTTDGGAHWQTMGLTETNFVEAIAINPDDSDEILAGGGVWDGSIYKSTDGGNTWQAKVSDIALVQDIVYDPRNPRWVYAATEGYGVLRSFNGGESWFDYSAGIFYPLLYSLAITEDDPPRLVVGSYGSGLYWISPPAPIQVYLPLVMKQ